MRGEEGRRQLELESLPLIGEQELLTVGSKDGLEEGPSGDVCQSSEVGCKVSVHGRAQEKSS